MELLRHGYRYLHRDPCGPIGGVATLSLIVNVPANSPTSATNSVVAYGGGDATHTDDANGATASASASVAQVVARVNVIAGNNQSAFAGATFATNLEAQVLDAASVPVPGVTVTFAAPPSGASAIFPGGNTATTNSSGLASVSATANTTPGTYTVTSSAGATSVGFTLTNLVHVPTSIVLTTPITVYVGGSVSFTATVLDQYGNVDPIYTGTLTFLPEAQALEDNAHKVMTEKAEARKETP